MGFWCAARLQAQREHLALRFLALNGYETYFPQIREQRRTPRGRKIEVRSPLFPGYCFVAIELQWHTARWCPCVIGLIMDGLTPARVPDAVIAEIRARERDGLIELPKPRGLQAGDRARVLRGPFSGHLALYAGMRPRERVEVLLSLLGARQRVILPKDSVERLG
jgi:transcriptional antiterminator RfaH